MKKKHNKSYTFEKKKKKIKKLKKMKKNENEKKSRSENTVNEVAEVPYPVVPSKKDKDHHLVRFLNYMKPLNKQISFWSIKLGIPCIKKQLWLYFNSFYFHSF